jgi:hypothetical protein
MTSFFIPRGLRVREADSNPSVIASELVFPNATLSVAGSAVTVQGLVVDGDKGDITVSASGATWTIDNAAVTTAKLGGDITTAGKALLDDADAAAQRTTLGLGTLATQSGTFSGTSSGTNTGDQTNISGNAATVTTNANLTGHVTSVGNAAVLGSFTKAQLDAAVSDGNVLYVGDVTSNATHTGDVTGDTALTIANAAVTLAKMANLAQDQFIGRTTASTGVPETATITAAARTVLDDATVADMVNTLGGATSTGTGGLMRAASPTTTGTLTAGAITASGTVTAAGNAVVHKGLRLLNDSTTIGSVTSIAFERTDTPGIGGEIRGGTYGSTGFAFFFGGTGYARHEPTLLELTSSTSLSWTSAGINTSTSTFMFRPAQNTLALRGGTGASIWYVYGTTDTTNYTRAAIGATATAVNLSAESAGTASANLDVVLTPKGTGVVSVTGNLTASATISSTANGAASTPASTLVGTWFTGGSSTTTKPQLLVEPTGTTSTGWSTSGTGIGVNAASGFTGNLMDLQLNGASRVSVSSAGNLTASGTISSNTIRFVSGLKAQGLQFSTAGIMLAGGDVIPGEIGGSGASNTYDMGTPSQLWRDLNIGRNANIGGNLTASGTLRVGGGTVVANILSATATLDFPSIGSNDTETLTITVTGAVAGDSVFLGCPAGLDAGLVFCASVTAADTVTVRMHNSTGGAVDPASATFRATVIRF